MQRFMHSPGIAVLGAGAGQPVPSVPFEQPKNLFRYGEQSLWSTYAFPSGGTVAIANGSYRLFSTALGASGQGFTSMTIAETNLKEAGRIPAGIAFDAYGISCAIIQGTEGSTVSTLALPVNTNPLVTNLVNVINNGVLSWDFTQTQVDIAPIHLIGAGGGAFGAVSTADTTTPATTGHMNNGAGSIWLYRQHPVSLPGNSTFSILLRFGAYAAALDNANVAIKVALFGFYKNIIEIG